jgi:predicted extracellular nuclease
MIDRRAALLVLALPLLVSSVPEHLAAQTIQAIQGRGHVSPLLGIDVAEVEGVVTALATMGARRGAFLQDPRIGGDGDTATSDAVFVALPADLMAELRPGDLVRVAGRVGEQRGARTGLSVTQIEVRALERIARDMPLPAAERIGASGRTPPGFIAPAIGDAIDGPAHVPDPSRYSLDFFETLEGMRIILGDTQAIGPRNSYGEVAVAADFARGMPLANARGGATTGPGATIAGRLIADDVLIGRAAMPDARVGDRLGDAVGIVDYAYANYRLLLTSPPEFTPGGLASEIAAPPRPGEVSIASFNVQNLAGTSRAAKFTALARQIAGALRAPEILALSEIQDDDGSVDSGTVVATRTYDRLVAAIVAAGGPRYAVAQVDPADGADGGAPGGNIRVAFLYDPLRVGFVPRAGGTADRAVALLPDGTLDVNPGRVAPSDRAWAEGADGFSGTRKPLAAMFEVAGRRLLLVAAHLKSRSEDQPDFGRIQAPGEPTAAQRLAQADAIASFLTAAAGIEPGTGIVLLGDLNATGGSPPLARLAEAGLFDLALGLPPAERYSYIFEGASQDLDHILVDTALRDIASLDIVHLNAEFPLAERASDHDPLLLRLAFAAPVPEPSSLALMLPPALLAAARRRHSIRGRSRRPTLPAARSGTAW